MVKNMLFYEFVALLGLVSFTLFILLFNDIYGLC